MFVRKGQRNDTRTESFSCILSSTCGFFSSLCKKNSIWSFVVDAKSGAEWKLSTNFWKTAFYLRRWHFEILFRRSLMKAAVSWFFLYTTCTCIYNFLCAHVRASSCCPKEKLHPSICTVCITHLLATVKEYNCTNAPPFHPKRRKSYQIVMTTRKDNMGDFSEWRDSAHHVWDIQTETETV